MYRASAVYSGIGVGVGEGAPTRTEIRDSPLLHEMRNPKVERRYRENNALVIVKLSRGLEGHPVCGQVPRCSVRVRHRVDVAQAPVSCDRVAFDSVSSVAYWGDE